MENTSSSAGSATAADLDLAADDQRDVHGPVVAALRVLARAVERVDDPDPLARLPVRRARIALLGEQAVVRALRAQHAAQPFVCDGVARLAELAPLDQAARAGRSQHLAGGRGEPRRERVVVSLSHGAHHRKR